MTRSDDYQQLVRHLARPVQHVVRAGRPSTAREWIGDIDVDEIETRISPFPARQAVFCLAVAAAESLHWWESWGSRRQMRPDDLELPRLTVDCLERWATHDAAEEELDDCAYPLQSALNRFELVAVEGDMDFFGDRPRLRELALAAHQTGLTLLHALGFRALRGDRDIVALCIDGFANAAVYRGVQPADDARREFLSRWWSRCHSRLAFRDATSASIE